jgi:hypothetical protein
MTKSAIFGRFLAILATFWQLWNGFLAVFSIKAHLEHGLNFFMSYRNMEFTIPYAFQGKIFVVFWYICYLLPY